jgi:hypothetical protein
MELIPFYFLNALRVLLPPRLGGRGGYIAAHLFSKLVSKIMNKTLFEKSQNSDGALMPEYHFGYQKAKANRSTDRQDQHTNSLFPDEEEIAKLNAGVEGA